MASKDTSNPRVGVLGAGSFGTAVANLLAVNQPVYLYARRPDVVETIRHTREHLGQPIHANVVPTTAGEMVLDHSYLIFPTVPSSNFRTMIRDFAPHFRPDHILIHCTKGLDFRQDPTVLDDSKYSFSRTDIATMSEVIQEETVVLRIGAMAGPNLAGELAAGKPAATVIASHFDEVIRSGRNALRSRRFQVYGNHDIIGVELSGVLKNAIAIGAGIASGLEMGENARALLITKGWGEMIRLGQALGSDTTAFMGLAGIGDLIATCNSRLSRNHTVGYRLAQGETLEYILETSSEVAEGVNTIRLAKSLAQYYEVKLPIIKTLHEVLYHQLPPNEALSRLMMYSYAKDVDFL